MPDLARILDLLERDDALHLAERLNEPSWPDIDENEAVFEVDYGRLFPTRRPTDRGQQDFELFGDDWELPEDQAGSVLEGPNASGAGQPPEWDVWAWYQPIHFFGPDWGIFIRETGLAECARRIAAFLPPGTGGWRGPSLLAKSVLRASFAALFLHEQYHHKTESLALRMHVVERRPIYPSYHRAVYRATAGTKNQIEEGLANADSWYRVGDDPYGRWTGATVTATTRRYLERSFSVAPPGYANAADLLGRADFEDEQQRLFTLVQEGLAPRRTTPSEFGIATHLNHSLFRVNQRIWTVVPAGARTMLPTHPGVAPLATRQLERFIKSEGWREVPGGGKGSHRKFRDVHGRMIVLPNSKDVSLTVLRTTAEALGLPLRDLTLLAS
jgi:predicted RNA binding protein YcfA (HicA-like mRNA interferase family)